MVVSALRRRDAFYATRFGGARTGIFGGCFNALRLPSLAEMAGGSRPWRACRHWRGKRRPSRTARKPNAGPGICRLGGRAGAAKIGTAGMDGTREDDGNQNLIDYMLLLDRAKAAPGFSRHEARKDSSGKDAW